MDDGGAGLRAVILVEGPSDRAALAALARRRGRDLDADRVTIVSMDGVTNIGRELRRYGPAGLDVHLSGLYDSTAEIHVRRSLERACLGPAASGHRLPAIVAGADDVRWASVPALHAPEGPRNP